MFEYRPFAPRVLEGIAVKSMGVNGRYFAESMGVDIEQMIDDIRYQIVYREELPGSVDAFCVKGKLIIVRESALENIQRYRFTLAEEWAHIKVHLPLLEQHGFESVLDARLTSPNYKRLEDDAKYLGAAILMDGEKFRSRFYYHADTLHPRHPSLLQARLRRIVKLCAEDFDVTFCAASRRAQSLGLITKEASIAMTT